MAEEKMEEIPVIVIEDEDGNEQYYHEEVTIEHEGKKFSILVQYTDTDDEEVPVAGRWVEVPGRRRDHGDLVGLHDRPPLELPVVGGVADVHGFMGFDPGTAQGFAKGVGIGFAHAELFGAEGKAEILAQSQAMDIGIAIELL